MSCVSLNAGALYVGTPDGELHPIGECEEMELCAAVNDKDIPRINTILSTNAELTITLTQDQVDAFIDMLLRVREHAIDMVRVSGYHRVAHLASRSRKWRTRKKNLFRAYRILQR